MRALVAGSIVDVVFATAFLALPVGALVFGRLGDQPRAAMARQAL